MYDQFYGFTGRPFQLTPDPAFYFESSTHRKAMSYLGYGLAQGEGFIVITGEIGAGKTTLVAHLMATIDPRRLTAVQIVSTRVGGDDMLRLAAQGFGMATEGVEKAQILSRIEAHLHQQARAGKRSLLIVDEAQNLTPGALEELRMLSNFQLGGQPLLQIFLLGQPEFRDMLNGETHLEQLRQRIIATHHLEPMQADEVAPYIEHRLKIVGWTGKPRFTPDAYAMLARESAGVPRRLNALVSRVLLLGALDQLDIIDARVIEAVVADTGGETRPETTSSPVSVSAAPVVDHAADLPAGPDLAAEPANAPEETAAVEEQDIMSDLHAIRSEVASCSQAMSGAAPDISEDIIARLSRIEQRMTAAESRLVEQDEVLRRVLAKLIDWAERDERNGPFAHRAA